MSDTSTLPQFLLDTWSWGRHVDLLLWPFCIACFVLGITVLAHALPLHRKPTSPHKDTL